MRSRMGALSAIVSCLLLVAARCAPEEDFVETTADGGANETGTSGPDGTDPPGMVDAATDAATKAETDAETDAATDAEADAAADAEADAATDAEADAAADAETDAAGDATSDAGGPVYLAFVCARWSATDSKYVWRMIDSSGNRWVFVSQSGPRAGDPVPPGLTTYTAASPAVDLPNLLAAAAAMDVSNAGYTTTSCLPTTGLTRMGNLHTAARPLDPTKVATSSNVRAMNGMPGFCEKVITNDPAWQELRKYNCDPDIGTSSW